MKKRIEEFRVIENKKLNEEFFVLKLQSPESLPDILPGQFAEVKTEGSATTFLRRPISIYDIDYKTRCLYLLIKIAGDGTRKLSLLTKNQSINLVYPLGNSFSKPPGSRVLLIGGGTGVAPLLFLGKYLKHEQNIVPEFLLGYRKNDLIIELEKFNSLGKVHITTEDGSTGHRGYVIDHPILNDLKNKKDMIYTCGPEIMMKAVDRMCKKQEIPCEVSLENLMGCGIGACLCCVVDTVDKGNVNTCTEGPVFNSKKLKWLI